MSELLHCPFCGGKGSDAGRQHRSYTRKEDINAWWSDGTPVETSYFCSCISCGASNRGMLGFQTQDEAVAAWNRRAEAPHD